MIFHAQPRFTKDLDVFIQADPVNGRAVFAALASFGAPLQGLGPEDFSEKTSFYRFGSDPYGFDILPNVPGVVFEEAWSRRIDAVNDQGTGLTASFISAPDLIAAKLASGRLQDLADAEAVQKAQQLLDREKSPPA